MMEEVLKEGREHGVYAEEVDAQRVEHGMAYDCEVGDCLRTVRRRGRLLPWRLTGAACRCCCGPDLVRHDRQSELMSRQGRTGTLKT
jgi:hypothetical protein